MGYSNASKAVMNHVDLEDKKFEMIAHSQNGNVSETKTAIATHVEEDDSLKQGLRSRKANVDSEDKGVGEIQTPGGIQNHIN